MEDRCPSGYYGRNADTLGIEGEVTHDEYAVKRVELQDRPAAIRLQLECSDRDDDQVADLAIKAVGLSQSLTEKWLTANYNAKRTILSIMLEIVRLNSGNLEFTPRKPFNLLRDENLVPLNGETGLAFPANILRNYAKNAGRL